MKIASACALLGILLGLISPAQAQLISLGSAGSFLALDLNPAPGNDSLFDNGVFTGHAGLSAGNGKKFTLSSSATLNGDLYRAAGSTVDLAGPHNGSHFPNQSMAGFIAAANSARTQFQGLTANQTFGTFSGGTIARSGANTVVDITHLDLSSTTLNVSGNAGDFFYFRVSDTFNVSSSSITITGTDAAHVFFYYSSSSSPMSASSSSLAGNFFAPHASVAFSSVGSFAGTLVSGNGFSLQGATSSTAFDYVAPVPEPSFYAFACGLVVSGFAAWRRLRKQA